MPPKYLENIRKINRSIVNPIIKLVAGRSLYALVYHTGRKSGKEYATPVMGAVKDGTIFIGLPYGVDTDWILNIQAAGSCRVKIEGATYTAANPELAGPESALPVFSDGYRQNYKKARIKPTQFLKLTVKQ